MQMMQPRCEEGKRLMQKQDFFLFVFRGFIVESPPPPSHPPIFIISDY